jgi:SAM-dependent methyltransferase
VRGALVPGRRWAHSEARRIVETRKKIEQQHYEAKAASLRASGDTAELGVLGAASTPLVLRRPYTDFEAQARQLAPLDGIVLDLGAGTGTFSLAAGPGRTKVATDISQSALALARVRAQRVGDKLLVVCADTECLPFRDHSVDLITTAGALYCFDFARLSSEVRRLLRPAGAWLVVDAFNHNIIYRFNRLIGWLRGTRTRLGVTNIPNETTLEVLRDGFGRVRVSYYGVLSFVGPLLAWLVGEERAAGWLDRWDATLSQRFGRFGFKIVFTAQQPIPVCDGVPGVVNAPQGDSPLRRRNTAMRSG